MTPPQGLTPDPGVFTGVIRVFKIDVSGVRSHVGYAATDPIDSMVTWWVIRSGYSYPVDLDTGEKLELEKLDDAGKHCHDLLTWATDPTNPNTLANPTVFKVWSGTMYMGLDCP